MFAIALLSLLSIFLLGFLFIQPSKDDSLRDKIATGFKPPTSIPHNISIDIESPSQVDPQLQSTPTAEVQRLRFPEEFETFRVPNDIVYSKDGPQPDQVVMLMATDGEGHPSKIPQMIERTMENRKKYAERHGYHFHFINITKYDLGDAETVWPYYFRYVPTKMIPIFS